MRTTIKEVEGVFGNFLKACGKREAKKYDDVGGWQLDNNPIYGGYIIHEIHNKGGGVNTPFGTMRMKPAEFVAAMRFAMNALDLKKGR